MKYNRDNQKWKWWREDDLETVKGALARAIAETGGFESGPLEPPVRPKIAQRLERAGIIPPLETAGAETALAEPENPAEPSKPAPVALAPKPEPPKPSPVAFAIADFARSIQAAKNGRPGARIVDHRDTRDAAALTAAQFGDPSPERSALNQREDR